MEISFLADIDSKFIRYVLILGILAAIGLFVYLAAKIIRRSIKFKTIVSIYIVIVLFFSAQIVFQYIKEKRIERQTFELLDSSSLIHENKNPTFSNMEYDVVLTYVPLRQFRTAIENRNQGYTLYIGNYNNLTYEGNMELFLFENMNDVQNTFTFENVKLDPFEKKKIGEFLLKHHEWEFDNYYITFDGHFVLNQDLKDKMAEKYNTGMKEEGFLPLSTYFLQTDFSGTEALNHYNSSSAKEAELVRHRYDLYLGNEDETEFMDSIRLHLYEENKLIKQLLISDIELQPGEKVYVTTFYTMVPFDRYELKLIE